MTKESMKSFKHFIHYVNAYKESKKREHINDGYENYLKYRDIAYNAFTHLVSSLYHDSQYRHYNSIITDIIKYYNIKWFFVQKSLTNNKVNIEDFMDILPPEAIKHLK